MKRSSARAQSGGALAWIVAAIVLGCGGRVEPDPDAPSPERDSTNGGQEPSAGDSGRTDSNTDGAAPGDLDSNLTLGDCVPGWAAMPGEVECPWFGTDQRCYASKEDACACLCPRTGSSICVSGLPGGPHSQTPVSCD